MNRTVTDLTVVRLAEEYIIEMRKRDTELEARKWGHNLGHWRTIANKPSKLFASCTNPGCAAEGLVDRAEDAMNGSFGRFRGRCPLVRR